MLDLHSTTQVAAINVINMPVLLITSIIGKGLVAGRLHATVLDRSCAM